MHFETQDQMLWFVNGSESDLMADIMLKATGTLTMQLQVAAGQRALVGRITENFVVHIENRRWLRVENKGNKSAVCEITYENNTVRSGVEVRCAKTYNVGQISILPLK